MSNYKDHARRLSETVREAFEDYQAAIDRQRQAEARRKEYPLRGGAVSADYAASSARAAADYAEATAELERTRRDMVEGKYRQQIKDTRKALAAEITADYTADPEKIDAKALELLKSGVMTSTDYAAMLRKALESGNHTMTRLVTKFAGDAAAARDENPMTAGDPETTALRSVAIQGGQHTGKEYLEGFDFMVDVFNRCIDNPAMIGSWDDLTGHTMKAFED